MPDFFWAIVLKPFIALILLGCFAIPGRIAVQRWMKDGKLKRLLLRRIS